MSDEGAVSEEGAPTSEIAPTAGSQATAGTEPGTVKFYDRAKGYGAITRPDGIDIFVHVRNIQGQGYRWLFQGEEVLFEDGFDEQRKRPQALNVSPVDRPRGIVESFDHELGHGRIVRDDGGPSVFVHHSAIVGTERVKTLERGEAVTYDIEADPRGSRAARVKRVDPRLPLYRFASLGKGDWVEDLAKLAEEEDWEYTSAAEAPEEEVLSDAAELTKPVLQSYLIYTFARIEEEGKIVYGKEEKTRAGGTTETRRYACFNTGLVTPMQEEIFALFSENQRSAEDGSPWRLLGFKAKSDRMLMAKFERLPDLANYFDDPSELLYDRRKPLVMDIPHITRENLRRFPEICRDNEHVARQLLEGAHARTEQRVYRNYKTAIPQFHRGKIELLLPLCLTKPNRADLALVVSRVGDQYRGNTVLPLNWAYSHARLITRPDTEWLRPKDEPGEESKNTAPVLTDP